MAKGCGCCGGSRTVPDIMGEARPCSRCNTKAFDVWATVRRQDAAVDAAYEAAKQKLAKRKGAAAAG